jgi:hypothetical protein
MLSNEVRGTLTIVQGPSASGKTQYLKACVARCCEGHGVYLTDEAATSILLQLIHNYPQHSDNWLSNAFADTLGPEIRYVAIDDADYGWAGKQTTQKIFANVIAVLCKRGIDVLLAGICLSSNTPALWDALQNLGRQQIFYLSLKSTR